MKIEKFSGKDKVWVFGLVAAAIFVLYMFTMDAIKNADIAIVDTKANIIIPVEDLN